MLRVLKRTVSMNGSYELPKHMYKLMGKKIIAILRSYNFLIRILCYIQIPVKMRCVVKGLHCNSTNEITAYPFDKPSCFIC